MIFDDMDMGSLADLDDSPDYDESESDSGED